MKATKLTSKHQTTIPQEIRKFLKINQGDAISFEIENNKVILKKVSAFEHDYLKSIEHSLGSEWNSKNDDESYDSL